MSQHPSLKTSKTGTGHRNVLKRYERVKRLQTEERWRDGDSVLGLPKVKSQKIKVKKVKEEKPAEGAPAATPAATTTQAGGTAPGAASQKEKGKS